MSTKNPFIAGSWVRGENFFGRQNLLHEILDGNRNYLWVAGTRRVGKTSLLKQIEYLTRQGAYANKFISLYWDLQGSQNLDGLKDALLESVEDAEEWFSDVGVEVDALESQDVFGILRALKRKAKEANLKLMLLCDESEELISIEKNNPEALPKLRRIFQQGENIYTILTATKRLSKLERSMIPDTSPFLHGFIPPIYLTRLENQEAERLIRLAGFEERVIQEILEKTNNHPYLIQLVCRRLFESGDLQKVIQEVSVDDMIAHFFSVDFQYLNPKEKEILLHILQNKNLLLQDLEARIETPKDQLIKVLYELIQLGYIKQVNESYAISNYFFEQWLEQEKEKLFNESALKRAESDRDAAAAVVQDAALPEIGDTLAQHEILEKIGVGGMGVVFKARDLKLDRLVALKVLLPEIMNDEEFNERFILEARAASALNHPNITTIYQAGEENGRYFISMEYVQGKPLKLWRQDNAQDLLAQLGMAVQAGKGLAHAHKRNVIHRDVKSENIMVTDEGTAKVMDFGLAKIQHKTKKDLTKTGTTLGTLSYMSPEQASGLATDHRTDIFSFGVVLYELFTGQLPFVGEFELSVLYAIINEDPKPVREINPNVPEELEAIVDTALQKNKEKRYQTMEALVADLEKLRR
jgi:tRNA A-37 threonylcarbamoyl transferase component Bud32/predicted transcriptional regulator